MTCDLKNDLASQRDSVDFVVFLFHESIAARMGSSLPLPSLKEEAMMKPGKARQGAETLDNIGATNSGNHHLSHPGFVAPMLFFYN